MRGTRLHSIVCVWLAATTATGGCRTTSPVVTKPPAPIANTPAPAPATIATPRGRATVALVPDADSARLSITFPIRG
jgi:hypothetical protein